MRVINDDSTFHIVIVFVLKQSTDVFFERSHRWAGPGTGPYSESDSPAPRGDQCVRAWANLKSGSDRDVTGRA